MKQYLNKGLIYQWFNSSKFIIGIGVVLFGFIANSIINSSFINTTNGIVNLSDDYFYLSYIQNYIFLGFIFLAIYFFAGGINKRNNTVFLASGPYTKKEIKYNELICLIITLCIFIIAYIYIATTFYIRNYEVLQIINGYFKTILVEILKIIIFGIMGILFMLIVDLLFSNSVIAVIAMMCVIPESILIIITEIFDIFRYIGIGNNKSVSDKINELVYVASNNGDIENLLSIGQSVKNITFNGLLFEVILNLIIIAIILIIFIRLQNKYTLDQANKIFSSKRNENIVINLVSIAAGVFINLITLNNYKDDIMFKTGEYMPLFGHNLVKMLAIDIISIGLIAIIINKILKKLIKLVK